MRRIIKAAIIAIIILIIGFVSIILFKNENKENKLIDNFETNENEDIYDEWSDEYFKRYYDLNNLTNEEKTKINNWIQDGAQEVIGLLCQKNGDWSKLPISKDVREKYNEKEGILPEYEFNQVEVVEPVWPQGYGAEIIVTNDKERIKFYFSYDQIDHAISNINVYDIIYLTDKDGNELNSGFAFDDKHIAQNFETWTNVGLTDKYIEKYGKELLNLFIHYSPLEYNPIGFDVRKSDLKNNMAFFTVTSVLECKKREYEVRYKLDENKYLDDVEVKLINEIEIEPDSKNSGTKAFYLNSCLDKANISNSFKMYLENNGSYNADIRDINVDISVDEVCLDQITYNEYIRCYKMKNGNINSYYVRYYELENGIIDKITSEKLEYVNMTAEEVKEVYLKDNLP